VFDLVRLPHELDMLIRGMNPWWEGKPAKPVPPYLRWAFPRVLRSVQSGPAAITVLRGPRQVGKSTIQSQLIERFLRTEKIDPRRIFRVQFDELDAIHKLKLPVHSLVAWFESRIAGRTLNESAKLSEPVYLFLDEVQNLREWAAELKSLVDHNAVRVLVTGSSALRIEAGRDSLAGRIATVELGPLRLREVAGLALRQNLPEFQPENGLEPLTLKDTWRALQDFGLSHRITRDAAFSRWAERGGYPLVHEFASTPWSELTDQLVETVVNRAIQHDLRQGDRGRMRDETLLKEVFRIACRYTGQCPSQAVFVHDIKSALGANVGSQRIAAYLRFLEAALLIRLVPPLEIRLKKKRGAPKLCLCDHGLRAAWLQEQVPLVPEALANSLLADLAGHIVEGAVGQFLTGIPGLDVAHFPERGAEPEVDFVLTVGERRLPVEVKYRQRIDAQPDTRGLRAFIERTVNNAPFGVLVTMRDGVTVDDPRIVPVSLPSLLLLR
jgi:predicted AAA+ superfamily ATPase